MGALQVPNPAIQRTIAAAVLAGGSTLPAARPRSKETVPMTDDYNTRTTPETGAASDDSYAWTEPEAAGNDMGAKAREWLTQLQAMIENLATQAAPVVKEVGAKAAELAALAGDKAGPAAAKAADITGQAGLKLAAKSRDLAAELRRDVTTSKLGDATSETAADVADSVADTAADTAGTADEVTPSGVA
jgi:hypothetical protein